MAVAEGQQHVAPGLGPVALGQRPLHRLLQRRPGARGRCSENGAGGLRPCVDQQRARRRVGGAHARRAVDHQHAVGHLLDHQPVQLRLLARQLQAAARRQLLARQAAGQFAGQQRDDEQAQAGQAGLQHQRRRIGAAASAVRQATSSSTSATPAAVASASRREVSTPAISTGSTSKAA